jgi:hypothetical protein
MLIHLQNSYVRRGKQRIGHCEGQGRELVN